MSGEAERTGMEPEMTATVAVGTGVADLMLNDERSIGLPLDKAEDEQAGSYERMAHLERLLKDLRVAGIVRRPDRGKFAPANRKPAAEGLPCASSRT